MFQDKLSFIGLPPGQYGKLECTFGEKFGVFFANCENPRTNPKEIEVLSKKD